MSNGNPPAYNQVLFVCAARMAGQAIIVASYSYNSDTDLSPVKQALEQPSMNLSPGKHYSFNVGQLSWHLISDEQGLIYVVVCAVNYPQRCAHMCLEELQRTFVNKAGDKASTAKERSLDKLCASFMQKICQKYDNVAEVDKLAAVARKVDTVKLVMQENVDAALRNCVQLESIEKAAEELQQQAGVFKRNANELKNKMWWKNMKMRLIIAAIVLVILGIIIAIVVVMSKGK